MKHAYCIDCEWTGQDDGQYPRRCPACQGQRVVIKSNNELVRQVLAAVQSDQDREQAISDIRRVVDEGDYLLMTGLAGSLGGVQLD